MRPRIVHRLSALLPLLALCSCAGVMKPILDRTSPPGEMNADGTINPCHGYRTRPQDCGNALWNAAQIGRVLLGQTLEQVRAIMGHDPEEREASVRDGRTTESWVYLTNYDNDVLTTILFIDGTVTAISPGPRTRR